MAPYLFEYLSSWWSPQVDDEVMDDEPEVEDDDDDISKDKIISQPKGKKKGTAKSGNAKK